jgi:hypothetical protein
MYGNCFLSECNRNEQMTHLIMNDVCTQRETLSKKSKLVSITTRQIQIYENDAKSAVTRQIYENDEFRFSIAVN